LPLQAATTHATSGDYLGGALVEMERGRVFGP
jgi:hypothetical protein